MLPAKSRVNAPFLFKEEEEEEDGSMRLCVDFRGINTICVENTYPLPLKKDMLTHLAKGRCSPNWTYEKHATWNQTQCKSNKGRNGKLPSTAPSVASNSK